MLTSNKFNNYRSILDKLLKYDPEERITARMALRSDWCHDFKAHRKAEKG